MILKKFIGLSILVAWSSIISLVFPQKNEALTRFVNNKSLKYAGIGFKIMDVENKKVVCSYNENLSLCPASTLKAVTTASAMELLGPDFCYSTTIAYSGTIDNKGALSGDLLITGSGDPSLGSSYLYADENSFLKEWLAAIQKAGISSIKGDIVVIDKLYGYEGISNRWIWGDIGNYYASGTYGISIFDNSYQLHLKSGTVNTKPSILYTEPEIPGIKFENHLRAAANSTDSAYIHGIPFSFERRIYGTIPANRSKFTIKGDIPDPGLLLAQTLGSYLHKNGIELNGIPTTYRHKEVDPNKQLQLIHTHTGSTLKEVIKVTNFRSNNHFAEHLFYKTGWDKTQACTTQHVPSLAAERIKTFWAGKAVDTEGLFQYDGSGLSNANRISANTLVGILTYMQTRSQHAQAFYLSLPLAGVEGTVRSFLKGTSLAGKARIKSGSISQVHAYTGYIEKDGRKYAFALLVNNFTGSRAALRLQMEKLLLGVI